MARIKKGLLIAMSIFLVMACTEQKITEVSFDPGDVVPQEVLDTMNIDRYFTISETNWWLTRRYRPISLTSCVNSTN